MFQLLMILTLGLGLRLYGINWDQGFHLHPDERMLVMVADRIKFFSNLNPDFFNYGSLPIYVLKGTASVIDFLFLTNLANYNGMLLLGRVLSTTADLLIIFLIYKIALLLFKNSKVALLSSFFYAIAFFPIQNSHFFVVDVFLNLFATVLIYLLLRYLTLSIKQRPLQNRYGIMIIGLVYGAMLAAKFTAVLFYPLILITLLITNLINQKKISIKNILIDLLIFNFSFLIFYFLFMPYAFIDFQKFFQDVTLQIKMNSNPYIFPYTLQYIGTLPYFYYLKNIFLWGMGPIICIISLIGIFLLAKTKKLVLILYASFYLLYFLVIGRSAVKFMRYMLPIYPFLTIMAGYGLYYIMSSRAQPRDRFLTTNRKGFLHSFHSVGMTMSVLLIIGSIIWSLMFVNIYSQPHTRITATDWILKNIPKGSTLAIEHWDDRLPIYGDQNYRFVEMTLYNLPDDDAKWQILNEKLKKSDYVVIASNRLYVPLQKLKDCRQYKVCYPKTAEYYQKLFNGKLGFKQAAEFVSCPKLEIGNWKLEICDNNADESFTVYDHPKIMIFKKNF